MDFRDKSALWSQAKNKCCRTQNPFCSETNTYKGRPFILPPIGLNNESDKILDPVFFWETHRSAKNPHVPNQNVIEII